MNGNRSRLMGLNSKKSGRGEVPLPVQLDFRTPGEALSHIYCIHNS